MAMRQRRRVACLLLALAANLVAGGRGASEAAADAASACAPKFSFFPPGGEDRNVPSAWGKTAQLAAGNYHDDRMFTVVLTSSNNLPGIAADAAPMLHVKALHPLLTVGSSGMPEACTGFTSRAAPPAPVPQPAPAQAGPPLEYQEPPDEAPAEPQAPALKPEAPAAEAPAKPVAAEQPASPAQPAAAGATPAAAPPASPPQPLEVPATVELMSEVPATVEALVVESAPAAEEGKQPAEPPAGAPAAPSTAAALDAASRRRVLWATHGAQGDAASSGSGSGRHLLDFETVTTPAQYKLTYSLNDGPTVDTGEFPGSVPVQRIVLDALKGQPDGLYCLHLRLTIRANSGRMAGWISVPPTDLWSTTQVCFYKLDGRPHARVRFSTCSEQFAVALTDIRPTPAPLFPGSKQSLFSSVVHFEASLNRTKDWSWPSEQTPKSLDHWLVLSAGDDASKPYTWTPDDRVADGWYDIKLKASMTSDYPSLMAIGPGVAEVYDDASAPGELREKAGWLPTPQYANGTQLGIQHQITQFKSLAGPEEEVVRYSINDEISFNWDFDGFGSTYCFVDGVLTQNAGERMCRSPLNVRLPDTFNHTLRVVMQDVCNETFIAEATYGLWGNKLTLAPKARTPPPRDDAAGAEAYVYTSDPASVSHELGDGQLAGAVMRPGKPSGKSRAAANGAPGLRPAPPRARGVLLATALVAAAAGAWL